MLKSPREDIQSLRSWLERRGYGESFLRGNIESGWDEDKGFEDLCSFEGTQSANLGPTSYLINAILQLKRQ